MPVALRGDAVRLTAREHHHQLPQAKTTLSPRQGSGSPHSILHECNKEEAAHFAGHVKVEDGGEERLEMAAGLKGQDQPVAAIPEQAETVTGSVQLPSSLRRESREHNGSASSVAEQSQ